MTPDEFVQQYENALATQRWEIVAPLVHADACVTFSTGSVHRGKAAVESAFTANFAAISEEEYRLSNLHWVRRDEEMAVYLFDFAWRGIIAGQHASGSGRGTAVIVREGDAWQLLVEHLGPAE